MAVFRKYYDELTGTIGNVSENCFTDFAGKLFANFIIIMNQKSSATKKGLVPGAQELIDAVITYVTGIEQEEKDRTRKVLEIMETVEWLRDIVHRMRETYQPTPDIPKCTLAEDTDGQSYIVFLSFKWGEGDDLVDYLYKTLRGKGLDPWKDDRKMSPGQQLPEEIRKGVESCSLFVCVMSPGYFDSFWCNTEFEIANDKQKKLFPIQWKNHADFKYKPEHLRKYPKIGDNLLRHKFDTEAVNMEAEKAKCAAEIIRLINQ